MFEPRFVACSLDQNAAHRLGGCTKKMRAILPRSVSVRDQPQPGLMDQRCRLKCLAGHLMGHSRGRQSPQFRIDQRKQLLSGTIFTTTDGLNHLRNFSSLRHSFANHAPAWS
jgi:hypothetical protein